MQEPMLTLLKWLETHGPDDWHQVAIDWNWDAGTEILEWIAAQPQCDRATAQDMAINSDITYHLRYPDRAALMADAPYNVEGFDLVLPIIERWNTGFYTRSEIASYEPKRLRQEQQRYRAAEAERKGHPLPWQLDDSIFQPLEGRRFGYSYTEGWPPEVENDLRSRGIHW